MLLKIVWILLRKCTISITLSKIWYFKGALKCGGLSVWGNKMLCWCQEIGLRSVAKQLVDWLQIQLVCHSVYHSPYKQRADFQCVKEQHHLELILENNPAFKGLSSFRSLYMVHTFLSIMPISSPIPMYNHLLELSHRDGSNKW